MELSDYAQALGAAQRLVPSYDQLRNNALAYKGQQLQNRAAEQEIAARDQQAEQQQQLVDEFKRLGDNATPEGWRRFAILHPQVAKPISELAAGMEANQRTQVVRDTSQIRSTILAGKPEVGAEIVQRHIDADIAAGKQPNPDDKQMLSWLKSGDPALLKVASGSLFGILSGFNPDASAKNANDAGESDQPFTLAPGSRRMRADGTLIAEAPFAPQYRSVGEGETLVEVGSSGGGGPNLGGAGGGRGDTTRLINTDAGGGYVPDSVQTLGQFVGFGRALNKRGAKSSSAGLYQINGTTMAEFGPKALGTGWKDAPFNAENQDKVGAAIFDWAKGQPNPAAALRGRWVSLTPPESARLVRGGWEQARGLIAQKESGGPGASAAPPAGGSGARVVAQGAPKQRAAPAGYQYQPDGITLEPIPGGPADKGKSGGGKALPETIVKRLGPKIEARDQLTAALGTFKDDFAGHTVLGDASNSIQSLTGLGPEGQRDWWAQLRATDNVIRNQLFGASLTEGEKAAYNATTVTPRMTPAEIRRNLKSRVDVVNKALARQRNVLTKNGFSQDAVGALFDPLGQQNTPTASTSAQPNGKLIGLYQGKPVYQLANGKRVVAR